MFDEDLVVHWRNGANAFAGRIPACLAAEAAAARMVEIAPEDLAKVRFDLWAPNGEIEECAIADRVDDVLRAHAAKAEVKR